MSDRVPPRNVPRPVRHRDGARVALWAGDATQTSVEVAAHTMHTTRVGLVVSLSADMSDPMRLPVREPNEVGWAKWSVSGLRPGTRYFHRVTDTPKGRRTRGIGDVGSFMTLREVGEPCTIRLAVGSCAREAPMNPAAFFDIAEWGPDRTVHLGDFGYPDDLSENPLSHMRNWARNSHAFGIAKVQSIGCMDYIVSDHDDNGSGRSNQPVWNDPVTEANIRAWEKVVPARMSDTRVPRRGRWRSDVEGNVRFVKLDTRSLDKTDTRHPDKVDPRWRYSTMLGATQLAWLKGQIDAAATSRQLVVVFSDCAWNGTSPGPPIPLQFSDKWPSYIHERNLISDYAASKGADLFIVFGDSHGLQQDDGTNEKNGFASICCGPFDQQLHLHYQDAHQWNYPAGLHEGGGPYRHAQQYQRLTISQERGSSKVTVTAEARDCSHRVPGAPMTVRTMTKTYQLR